MPGIARQNLLLSFADHRFLPYGELERHREAVARFGHGMKAIEAVARTLTLSCSTHPSSIRRSFERPHIMRTNLTDPVPTKSDRHELGAPHHAGLDRALDALIAVPAPDPASAAPGHDRLAQLQQDGPTGYGHAAEHQLD